MGYQDPSWCHCPSWGIGISFRVPGPILGCRCPARGTRTILGCRCPPWVIRLCSGVPGPILGCHYPSGGIRIISGVPGLILGCHCPPWVIRLGFGIPRPILGCRGSQISSQDAGFWGTRILPGGQHPGFTDFGGRTFGIWGDFGLGGVRDFGLSAVSYGIVLRVVPPS